MIRLHKSLISKFKNNEGGTKYINCNIVVKQGFPLSPTLFAIYIDMLEKCLEEEHCVGAILVGIVITVLLYVDDIVLMEMCHSNIDKQLIINLKYFFSNMGMILNINKIQIIIIKSRKETMQI